MPLGLQITTVGALGGPGMMGDPGGPTVVVEDYMWQIPTPGELEPIPTTTDFNDIWDLDGTDYMLDAATATADEGYWILDTNSDVEPLDV